MKLLACLWYLLMPSYTENSEPTVYIMDNYTSVDTVIFYVQSIKSINKDNDKEISGYIKRFSAKNSFVVNEYRYAPVLKGSYLLFFWKNTTKRDYGFVVTRPVTTELWEARVNGQTKWSTIEYGQQEMFNWTNQGRSLSVTLMNDSSNEIKYIFSGDVDF